MESHSSAVIIWWFVLSVTSVLNVATWSWLAVGLVQNKHLREPSDYTWRGWQTVFSAAFTFGCAFRSFLPRAEAQRICLYDTWISNAITARSVATVAELCFVAQVAMVLRTCSGVTGSVSSARISWLLVPLIGIAEVFSWYTALTTNFFGSIVEESIWALTFTVAVATFIKIRPRLSGPLKKAITASIAGGLLYVAFMCTVDIPMYLARFKHAQQAGQQYLSMSEGWSDGWTRRVVTRRWEDWREEIPWMSLYFTTAVWVSLAMTRTPRMRPSLQ